MQTEHLAAFLRPTFVRSVLENTTILTGCELSVDLRTLRFDGMEASARQGGRPLFQTQRYTVTERRSPRLVHLV